MNPLKNELYTRIQTNANIFDFIQSVALDGFWYADVDLQEEPFINPRFWVTLGYSHEGPWPKWADVFLPEHDLSLHTLLRQWMGQVPSDVEAANVEARPPDFDQLLHFQHKAGKTLWLRCKAQVLLALDELPQRLLLAYTDVTEFKEKEILLTRCNTEAKIGYWEVNFQNNQIFWSEMTKLIHEVPSDYNPDVQAGIDFFDPPYKPVITALFEQAVREGRPYSTDLLLITALGKKKWTRAIGIPEMRDGVCQRLYGTFQDIDEAKRNQMAREESERKFKGIFDSTFSFIGFLNPDGVLLDANQTALGMAALSPEDVIGKPFWDCYWWQISAEAQRQLKQNVLRAAEGHEVTYEVEVWIANETPVTILFSLRPIFDAQGHVIFIVPEGRPIQDIVDARQRYKSVLEATQVGIWEWNVEKGTVQFNERWAEIIGYRLEELLPFTLETWKNSVHPEDFALAQQNIEACFTQQSEYYEASFRMRHKQGHWVWVQSTGKVLSWTADQQPLMMYGTHQEINTRKKDEAEIYRLLNLSQMQNERLNNFAHIVSHNLRSHTFSIQGVLEVLLLDHPELSDNTLIHMLTRASENLTATIADLSEMVTSDLLAPESKVSLDLHAMVRKNIESTATLAKKAQVQLINKVPKASRVKAIPAYLDSLTLNFMTNAIKYCALDRERVLEISLDSVEGFDRIAFTDNGLGIDLEKYGHKLFDMYQTFHTHADSRGIGLYITYNQVKAMGGRIEVTSELNKGTTFWVLLPQ
jgi:PAS domain S-box-containing protein